MIASRSSASGGECGSSTASARPGNASQVASPVSQSETRTPAESAVVATVNAWEQRSVFSSGPVVHFTTSARGCADTSVMAILSPHADGDVRDPRRGVRRDHRGHWCGRREIDVGAALNPQSGPAPDTTDLRSGPPIHDALLALLPLVGEWTGEGSGVSPAGENFAFGQAIRFAHDGRSIPGLRVPSLAGGRERWRDPPGVA